MADLSEENVDTDRIQNVSQREPEITNMNDIQHNLHDKIWHRQRELMLLQRYQEAFDLLPELEKELEREHDEEPEEYAIFYHSLYIYLCLMLEKEEEALSFSDKYMEKYRDCEPRWLFFIGRVGILSKFNKYDEIIWESNTIRAVESTPEAIRLIAAYTASLAYAMKNDLHHARIYLEQADKIMRTLDRNSDGEGGIRIGYEELIPFLEFYLDRLRDTHVLRFSDVKPDPPIRSPDDPEKKKIIFEYSYPFEIVSKKDGKKFSNVDMKKVLAEEAARETDPFLKAIQNENTSNESESE